MIDSDRAVRILHPMPGVRWTEIREAAVDCARHGWPVLPGTYQLAEDAGWLGKREAVGLEPVAEFWQMSTTTNPVMAVDWWTRRPYSVLMASAGLKDDHSPVSACFRRSKRMCLGEPRARQVLRTLSAGGQR